MHIRYALETVVLALGNMEKCVDGEDDHYYEAMRLLKKMKNHLEAVINISRKVMMSSIFMDKISFEIKWVLPSFTIEIINSLTLFK